MASFKWTDEFVTGHAAVDAEHLRLVELVNDYSEVIAGSTPEPKVVEAMLGEAVDYTVYHFTEEEALANARSVDLRHRTSHEQEHQRFLTDVGAIAARVLAGDPVAPRSLLELLIHWLAYHILVQDQNLTRQVAAIDAGATPAEAYEAQEREAAGATQPLVAALTGLLQQVSAQNDALTELNRTLEDKVAERTRALSEANAQLEALAMTDVLTGLPNRRHGMFRLRQLWDEAITNDRSLTCLMVDADGFKQINDTQGHDAGDVVLKTLARELVNAVRTDDVVCRLGGDEFLVICPNTDRAGGAVVGEALRATVAAMHVAAGQGVWHGSISIGVGTRSSEMGEHEELLKAADEGVYAAKRDGRNCVRSIQA